MKKKLNCHTAGNCIGLVILKLLGMYYGKMQMNNYMVFYFYHSQYH